MQYLKSLGLLTVVILVGCNSGSGGSSKKKNPESKQTVQGFICDLQDAKTGEVKEIIFESTESGNNLTHNFMTPAADDSNESSTQGFNAGIIKLGKVKYEKEHNRTYKKEFMISKNPNTMQSVFVEFIYDDMNFEFSATKLTETVVRNGGSINPIPKVEIEELFTISNCAGYAEVEADIEVTVN